MISRMRQQLGPAGFAVAVIALVAALAGGAYAASGGLTGKQKKEVEKISKKFAGKPGANGTNGKDGAAGANGKDGAPGVNGTNGAPGANGKSVEIGTATTECPVVGGVTVQVEGEASTKKKVCNGKEGSPWTAEGTLPSGATETGTWFITVDASEYGFSPISFPIPLAEEDAEKIVPKFWKSTAPVGECPGNVHEPKAEPGFLCIYGAVTVFPAGGPVVLPPDTTEPEGAADENKIGTSGALLAYQGAEVGLQRYGSFAVTAP